MVSGERPAGEPAVSRPGGAPEAIVPVSSAADTQSSLTVWVAFVANLLIAAAKSVAALLTGSASLLAEAAHSWADTGNEVFLLIANKRSRRPPEPGHSLGYGREAYVWSLFAAMGLFVAGATVAVWHGVQELLDPRPASDFLIGYAVLAVAFVLEGVSFLQSVRQARAEAQVMELDVIEHVLATSDPMLRAVFAEDSAALVGADRGARPGGSSADRVGGARCGGFDPDRGAVGGGGGAVDQSEPVVPGGAGGRPAGAAGDPAGIVGPARGGPGDAAAVGVRRSAAVVRGRRCRPGR